MNLISTLNTLLDVKLNDLFIYVHKMVCSDADEEGLVLSF